MKGIVAFVLLAVAAVAVPNIVSAQAPPPNVFVCVDNLTMPKQTKLGAPQVFVVNNCLGILAVGYGIQRDVVTGTTKVSSGLYEVFLLKEVDNVLSPWLTMSGLTGSRWAKVTIQVHEVGCTPVPGCEPIFQLVLSNALVTGVATSASTGTRPLESVQLVFDSATVNFPQ